MLRFTIPGKPEPKGRPRRGKGGHFYTPQSTSDYEARVRSIARAIIPPDSGWPTLDHVEVVFDIYCESDAGGDIDNIEKAIMDGLNKTLYHDDKQVKSKVTRLRIDRDNPRVEVCIYPDPGPSAHGSPYVYDTGPAEWVIRSPRTGYLWTLTSMKHGVRMVREGDAEQHSFRDTAEAMKAIHEYDDL